MLACVKASKCSALILTCLPVEKETKFRIPSSSLSTLDINISTFSLLSEFKNNSSDNGDNKYLTLSEVKKLKTIALLGITNMTKGGKDDRKTRQVLCITRKWCVMWTRLVNRIEFTTACYFLLMTCMGDSLQRIIWRCAFCVHWLFSYCEYPR